MNIWQQERVRVNGFKNILTRAVSTAVDVREPREFQQTACRHKRGRRKGSKNNPDAGTTGGPVG